jgi:hypothetical protein
MLRPAIYDQGISACTYLDVLFTLLTDKDLNSEFQYFLQILLLDQL